MLSKLLPFPWIAVVLSIWTSDAWGGASSATSPPLVVLFDPSAGDLPQAEIRAAVAEQLERQVLAEADTRLAELRIGRNANGQVVVRYRPPEAELQRSLAIPDDKAKLPILVALVAQNLLSGEPGQLIAELDAAGRTHGSQATEPMVSPDSPGHDVPRVETSARRAGPYLRLSIGAGFTSGAYTRDETTAPVSVVGLTGMSTGLRVAGGYMTGSALAFGLEGSLVLNRPVDTRGFLGQPNAQTTVDMALLSAVQLFVDSYPDRRRPFHMQAGIGITYGNFGTTTQATESSVPGSAPDVRPVWGPSAYVGGGLDFKDLGGLGLFVRTDVAYLVENRSTYTPVALQFGITMAWF